MSVVKISEITDLSILAGAESVSRMPMRIFSEEAMNFLADVSIFLLKNAKARKLPDVISFAYWVRRANLARQVETYREGLSTYDARMGRGLSFHIAPSNVPVNFAFSYAFALLAGNSCVVRVPSKPFAQVEVILGAIEACLGDYPAIRKRTAFVSYASDGDATGFLSKQADIRVIWGGDMTVGSIRKLETMPRCVDVSFADRYSIALFNPDAVLAADTPELDRLARSFYNDTYLMDQNACSSPQTILWLGNSESTQKAQSVFWETVRAYASSHYELQPAVAMDKYVQACGDLMRGSIISGRMADGYLTVADIPSDKSLSEDLRGVGGFFYEKEVGSLADIADDVTERYQTITYYGFDPEGIRRQVLDIGLRGVDRIVPVGEAMDIGLVWDGFDLIATMSRVVECK